jgi:hypothetical protein|eukprot:COSAG01_NODE_5018_length_4541_cov_2.682575_2_plen_107_part_00
MVASTTLSLAIAFPKRIHGVPPGGLQQQQHVLNHTSRLHGLHTSIVEAACRAGLTAYGGGDGGTGGDGGGAVQLAVQLTPGSNDALKTGGHGLHAPQYASSKPLQI